MRATRRSGFPARWLALVACLAASTLACPKNRQDSPAANSTTTSASSTLGDASTSAAALGAPRAGMIWVPPGVLRAGTPPDRVPRVAEEELPGTEVTLAGYYIDELPFPDEAGAIPTTNATRADAVAACSARGKRLCSELEWERACKGPGNTTYEYGDGYRAAACGTGVAAEESARRPTGDRVECKSGFGVREMHGGVWEWTDSPWGRGAHGDLGVLRGGNAVAGELAGRCANALGRAPTTKNASMGFRCCAGPRNEAEVELGVKELPALERSPKPKDLAAPLVDLGQKKWGPAFSPMIAWTWHPVANEELVVATGCGARSHCGIEIARVGGRGEPAVSLAEIDAGRGPGEVVQFGDAAHLRMRGLELRGAFLKQITYAYGRVEVEKSKDR